MGLGRVRYIFFDFSECDTLREQSTLSDFLFRGSNQCSDNHGVDFGHEACLQKAAKCPPETIDQIS